MAQAQLHGLYLSLDPPPDIVLEMDEINDDFPDGIWSTGAFCNSPLWKAQLVISKRGRRGYSGIENPHSRMNAKETLNQILSQI